MKVCVYSIAKNEEQHVQRWYDSAKDADILLLGDTGSSDDTVKLSEELGITTVSLNLNEFRFDTAKNELLKHVDADVYVNLDLDEILLDDWRTLIEQRYYFDLLETLYERPNGELKSVTKIHSRNCVWKGCIHEFIRSQNDPWWIGSAKQVVFSHKPDLKKKRSNYFDLLQHSVYNEFYKQNRAFNLFQYGLMLKDKKKYGEALLVFQAAAYECKKYSPGNVAMVENFINDLRKENEH